MKYKKSIISIILLLSITLISYSYFNKKVTNSKLIDENVIASLKMNNIKNEIKDVKEKSDITKIVMLINNLNVLKSDLDLRTGVGYGVDIIYDDGKTDSFKFLANSMIFNGKCYEIDKDIVGDLINIYKKIDDHPSKAVSF